MSRPYKNICIKQYETFKNVFVDVVIENTGSEFIVPVYLYNVCPCRKMVVSVTIFSNGIAYATEAKKIFTGRRRWRCYRVNSFFVGDFTFLLTDNCIEKIRYKIAYHYIF